MTITLNDFFANPLLAQTHLERVIDAVYDEIDDDLIFENFAEAEDSIKKILAIEPYTELSIYLSARAISWPFKHEYKETYKALCKKIYDVSFAIGGNDKVISIVCTDPKAQEILEHEKR